MNAPLRIAMISQYLPGGSKIGVGYQVHALANALAERGHDVTVWSACAAGDGARYRVEQIAHTGSLRTFRFAAAMRKVDLAGYDVLHAHGDDYWLWRRRVPVHVRTMHGSCLAEALRIRGLVGRARMVLLGLGEEVATVVADRTVVVSPDTRRWMPWVRQVIPNGVDTTVFSPGPTARSPVPAVLFVGTYEQRKRGRLLMEVFEREVRPAVPDAELWMVCSDAPPAAGVVRLGRVGQDDLVDLYRRAWVFCLPSSYEGFGIPYAEALACGTPVVATPNEGARYVLAGGAAGVVCDPSALGAELVRLLRDDVARDRLTAAGLARSGVFDLDGVVDAYERLYRSGTR